MVIVGNNKRRMMEETMHLSSHEKAKLENEKQIYCLLRLINYVEKFYSTYKIDQLTYQNEINKLVPLILSVFEGPLAVAFCSFGWGLGGDSR